MNAIRTRGAAVVVVSLLSVLSLGAEEAEPVKWDQDSTWHDGLVEKATYDASRVIYGRPRTYEAVFFTNKEQHDRATWTKSHTSSDTVEVWKHNQIEVVPTPNYDYKFAATSHLTVGGNVLTRLDASSQEFCGTSFKQYQVKFDRQNKPMWDYWGFSYMPEAGRVAGTVEGRAEPVVAFNALPLWLRDYDFAQKPTVSFALLPDQKSNRATDFEPVAAEVRYAGETDSTHRLQLVVAGNVYGTYEFARDRLHVMTRYEGADGLRYELKSQERVNYWTIVGE